jgi:signal transduction histidine kinase
MREGTWQWLAASGSLAAYALVVAGVAPAGHRSQVAPLSLVPVVACAAVAGLRGGLAATAVVMALNVALAFEASASLAGLIGHLVILLSALGVSWLRALLQRTRAQASTLASLMTENSRLSQEAAEEAALRRLGELKDELRRTVSHELRTPLSYIYGYSELLLLSDQVPERERGMIQEIHRGAEHMRRLLDDLLDLDRIQSGQLRLERTAVDLPAVIADAIEHVREAEATRHQFAIDVARGQGHLLAIADPARVRQVLLSLLTNAVRYSPDGSQIQIAVRLQAGAAPDGSARASVPPTACRFVEVRISDQGPGLAEAQCERIFEKFYRGHVNVTGKHLGAGLGLAICRSLVEAQGGRIWAESDGPGQGATLRFTLPAAPDSAGYALRTKASAASMAALGEENEPRLR